MTATAERLDTLSHAHSTGADVYNLVTGQPGIRGIRDRLMSLWSEDHDSLVPAATRKAALRLAVEIASSGQVRDPHVFLLRDGRHSFEWHPDDNPARAYASLVLSVDGKSVEQYIGIGDAELVDGSVLLSKGVRTFVLSLNAIAGTP